MAGLGPPGAPTQPAMTSRAPQFPGPGPLGPPRPPVNGQAPPNFVPPGGGGAFRPLGPPVKPLATAGPPGPNLGPPGHNFGPPGPTLGPPRPVIAPPVTRPSGPPQFRPSVNGALAPQGPPQPQGTLQPQGPPQPSVPLSRGTSLGPNAAQPGPGPLQPPSNTGPPGSLTTRSSSGTPQPVPPFSATPSLPPQSQGLATLRPSSFPQFQSAPAPPPLSAQPSFSQPPSSQSFAPPSTAPPTYNGFVGGVATSNQGGPPTPQGGPPTPQGGPPTHQGGPPTAAPPPGPNAPPSSAVPMSNFGRRYPAPTPPSVAAAQNSNTMMGPPNSMAPPSMMGPPSSSSSMAPPPLIGPPSSMSNGPQSSGYGAPPLNHGPPPMGSGGPPPMTGGGPPPMSNGPPPMSNGPPPMSNGPPLLGNGPPLPGQQSAPGMPPMPPRPQPGRFGADTASLSNQLGGLSVTQNGFQKMWGQESLDLLQNRHILPSEEVTPPKPRLQAEQWNNANCSSEIFRSTLTKIPETEALLKKARLPLGVLIHPFKDLSHLPVIQCTTIVRCRSCRTYINPFVHFVDQRRWRCNLCYRVNELPEEFLYDPVSKSYGDPSRRPECKSSTIEFIAPQEYMLRPPQPAVYLFLLDVSRAALETGYLRTFCDTLMDELDKLPGDGRTQVGFITYHRTLQFYQLAEGATQATQLIVGDVDDVFLPSPSDLLANLSNCRDQVVSMLTDLPELFNGSQETENCLGAALQAAYKMVNPTGGRITVVQGSLPNVGPGAVENREAGAGEKSQTEMVKLLNPSTDFYKRLALECSGQQIAVDLFVIASQHCDLATLSGISKFSGGQVQTFPGYHSHHNPPQAERFERALRRYLTRKIGFEAVMRIRCTRGMSLHTFHGHFFVRSTDLLSLPNVNPDSAFGMQVSIEEDLKDSREVSFQAALLYTSSKGERRIRVHTLCLPTTASLQEVIQGADQHCTVGLLSKMAVDRTLNSSLADAREAFINVCVDAIERWKLVQCINQPGVLPSSSALKLLPLLVLAALKSPAFSSRPGLKLDERSAALIQMKCLPLASAIQALYPDMYRVDALETAPTKPDEDEDGGLVPDPPRLQLSAEKVSLNGAYLMDCGDKMILFVGKVVPSFFCEKMFGVSQPSYIDENLTDLPELDNEDSERLRSFVASLNLRKSHPVPVRIIRDDSKSRTLFTSLLADDRSENTFSYYEFLQHLKTQVK